MPLKYIQTARPVWVHPQLDKLSQGWVHSLPGPKGLNQTLYPTSPGKQSPNFSKQKFLLYAIHEIFFDQVEEERLITFLLLIPSAPLFLTIISWQ